MSGDPKKFEAMFRLMVIWPQSYTIWAQVQILLHGID